MQPGPPFKVGDIVVCTPTGERRQVALVTAATPPNYKVLLENGTILDTAVSCAHLGPDWNQEHPEVAPRDPDLFGEQRRALLQKRNSIENIDIHRRAKRRRVAFADSAQEIPVQLNASQTHGTDYNNRWVLPPAVENPLMTPPQKPPPKSWTSDPILADFFPEELGKKWGHDMDSQQETATTMDMDEETMTTAPMAEDTGSEWDSDDEHDDEGKPTSLMQPQHLADVHPFVNILHEWKEGIEVDCGTDWEWATIEEAVLRGPHPTACTEES